MSTFMPRRFALSLVLPLALVCFPLALAGCNHPSPACPPNQTQCGAACFNLQSDSNNCGACGAFCSTDQVCVAGACTYDTCSQPDVYATCLQGAGLVGVCSATGFQLPTATISAPSPDAGSDLVIGELASSVFVGDAGSLWLLDYENSQIDIVNVSSWPPVAANAQSIYAGVTGTFDPIQLITCDGMVLVLRQESALLEGFDAQTHALSGEVSLVFSDAGGFYSPGAAACDGDHKVYVTDSANNLVTAIDLSQIDSTGHFAIAAQTTLPASDYPAALPDGGTISPYLTAIAVSTGVAPFVVVALENLGPDYNPAAPATVFRIDPALQTWSSPGNPGATCENTFSITTSPDQTTTYEACAGIFDTASATTVQPGNANGYVGVTTIAGPTAQTPIKTTLSNPTSLAFLRNGLLAIGDDFSDARIAFYNPADGGVTYASVACPGLADGGINPLQTISSVVAAP